MLSLTGSDDPVPATSCTNRSCDHAHAGLPVISGKPTLIDFHDSMLDRRGLAAGAGTKIERRLDFAKWLGAGLLGANVAAPSQRQALRRRAAQAWREPMCVDVGGGKRGVGPEAPRQAGDINMSFHSEEIERLADGEPMAPRETISYYPGVR